MNQPSDQSMDHLPKALISRCVDLGIAAWLFDGDAKMVTGPHGPASSRPWLEAPVLADMIVEQVREWVGAHEEQPVELFRGAWLVPITDPEHDCLEWIVPALVLQPECVQEETFAAVSASAGHEVGAAAAMLESLIESAWPDARRVERVLRHTRDDLRRAARDASVIEEFSDQLAQSYEETNLLYRLGRLLKFSSGAVHTVETTCHQIREIMAFEWVAVLFHDTDAIAELAKRFILVGDLPTPRDAFQSKAVEMMVGWKQDDWTRVLTPDSNDLARMVDAEVVAEPITHDGRIIGALLAGNKSGRDPNVSSVDTQFLDATADFLGVFHENAARFEDQRVLFFGTLQALIASIDAKDRYTCGHSERVSLMAWKLAAKLDLSETEIEEVRIAGLVHDVGKIGVPESVLTKPGRLTREEFEQMKRHPVVGHEILNGIPQLAPMLPGVLYHHERWDGKGYPEGLAGERIPLYGRILACADAFDAMSSTRSYRAAMTRDEVFAEFENCAGTQFDPRLAEIFIGLDFSAYDEMVQRHHGSERQAA